MDFVCAYMYKLGNVCVYVCVTGSPKQGAAVGQRPPVQTSVPGGGV